MSQLTDYREKQLWKVLDYDLQRFLKNPTNFSEPYVTRRTAAVLLRQHWCRPSCNTNEWHRKSHVAGLTPTGFMELWTAHPGECVRALNAARQEAANRCREADRKAAEPTKLRKELDAARTRLATYAGHTPWHIVNGKVQPGSEIDPTTVYDTEQAYDDVATIHELSCELQAAVDRKVSDRAYEAAATPLTPQEAFQWFRLQYGKQVLLVS